jgi:hypothetical protein
LRGIEHSLVDDRARKIEGCYRLAIADETNARDVVFPVSGEPNATSIVGVSIDTSFVSRTAIARYPVY